MIKKSLIKISIVLAPIVLSTGVFANSLAKSEPSADLRAKMTKIGTIKEVKPTQSQGVFAWTFEKNGKTLVLYNTPDQKHFIQGTIFNIENKKSITSQFPLDSLKYASPDFKNRVLKSSQPSNETQRPTSSNLSSNLELGSSVGFLNLKWDKPIPQALTLIDNLASAKQGKGQPQDTLYIFYDPRCPWCHKTYNAVQPYIKKGYTVKWIPTLALGNTPQAMALASAPLQNINLLDASFNSGSKAKEIKPTPQNIKDINTNFQFLRAYFQKAMENEHPSVPLGLFLDKTTGKITHIQGISDKNVLDLLFGQK